MKFRFIQVERASFPVPPMCRVLEVSRSGFYAWQRRQPSAHAQEDVQLGVAIRAIHQGSRQTYGAPRVHAELHAHGRPVGRKRVARLMKQDGLRGRRPRRWRTTTDSQHAWPIAENVVQRVFHTDAPNQVWVTDITYVWTWEGWLYLAVVLDLFARRVVGWAMADHLRTELPLAALEMAMGRRLPPTGLVHHSDRGVQYASTDYRDVLAAHGVQVSMSRKGNCWDNAVAESFFATLKTELVAGQSWPTRRAVRDAIAEYIELFYNSRRRHSTLGYCTPMEYERQHHHRATTAA